MEFKPFPKIPRLRRGVVITEKLDGTNAQVIVTAEGQVLAGSRNRFITPEDDNYGFAAWVYSRAEELRGLGEGIHYGEWWGRGIQRRYDMEERRFSLFDVARWGGLAVQPPACCHVVPVLAIENSLSDLAVDGCLAVLREQGSVAAPGFMSPEGVVVYHTASRSLYKVLLENDEAPKGVAG